MTPDILTQFYELLIDKTGEDTVKNGSTDIEDNYLTFRDANGILRGKINLLGVCDEKP